MSKKYAYIYSLYKDDGYWTGFASIEDALAAARKRKPEAKTVCIFETEEFVPYVRHGTVINQLQEDIENECAQRYPSYFEDLLEYGGFFDDVSQEDKDMLSDMLTATFVCWAKKRGIEYGVDIPVMLLGLYNLQTGEPVEEESK